MKNCIRCLLSVSFLFFSVHCLCGAVTNGEPSKQNAGGQRGLPVEEICRRLDATVLQIRTNAYPWARSDMLVNSVKMLNRLSEVGDKSLLPYLAEKSIDAANPETVRSRAAAAYVKIATAEECAGFLPKILALNDDKGHWRYGVTSKLLDKIDAAVAAHGISNESLTKLLSALVAYTQSTAFSTEAEWVDNFLVKHCDGYRTSKQRLFLWSRIVKAGNELEKEHFIPVKETIEAVPENQRTDLRDRFPGLPPLPEDKNAGKPLKIALLVGAALAAACAAILIALKHRKTRKHADGQPDNPR